MYMWFLKNSPQETTLQRILRTGEIRLGTSPDYPPFESLVDTGSGLEIAGFDIELAKKVTQALEQQLGRDITLKIEAAFFNALMAGLNTSAYDMVIAAFAIRPYREQAVDFSIPYYFSLQCCVVKTSETSIAGQDDLEGKKIAVQTGTSGEEIAGGLKGDITAFPSVDMMLVELENGKTDAIIIDVPVAQHFVNSGKNVKVAFSFDDMEIEGFGIAMREGEGSSLVMAIMNGTISYLNETGTLATMFSSLSP